LKYAGYYFAGITSHTIYIGNYFDPLEMLITNYGLINPKEAKINISDTPKSKFINLFVDSPDIYLNTGFPPLLLRSRFPDLYLERFFYKSKSFIECLPLSPNCIVIKAYDSRRRQYDLLRQTIEDNRNIQTKFSGILEKQLDGKFCIDGTLNYNRNMKKLIYVYRYRNQFICMDTNLNLLYRKSTIDTNNVAKIDISVTYTKDSFSHSTLSASSLVVNKNSFVSNEYVFINSNLLADNEKRNSLVENSIIDLYSLADGGYKFSFYVPDINDEQMRSFVVNDHALLALYDHALVMFKLDL